MKQLDTVAIIGVGLIGGSIGLALRQRALARTVVGIGRTASRLRVAEEIGAVSWATTDVGQGVADADLIVVCTPVGHVVDYVQQVSRACPADALITDAGSTKGEICRTLAAGLARNGVFVGSHPLAGSEKSGPEFADPNLFEGASPWSRRRRPPRNRASRRWKRSGGPWAPACCGCRPTNTTGRSRKSAICRTCWPPRWRPPPSGGLGAGGQRLAGYHPRGGGRRRVVAANFL